MSLPEDLKQFLNRSRIDKAVWVQSGLDWATLTAIRNDHVAQFENLRVSAELFAGLIQRFPSVHSVRWRIKNPDHLLEKIVRKCVDQKEKYRSITEHNYFEIVTDLVGLRALHLFKDDCFSIDEDLRNTWTPAEPPKAYFREGDPQDLIDRFQKNGFEVEKHPAGYRSIHYVCSTQPVQRRVLAEIQVRTIFEEGWSEIDHRVRYPNFSENELVAYFLNIFNRLAGSADEMGTFVQDLTTALSDLDAKLIATNQKKEEALAAMDKTLSELEALRRQDADTNKKLNALQREITKLRGIPTIEDLYGKQLRDTLASVRSLGTSSLLANIYKNPALAELARKSSTLSSLGSTRTSTPSLRGKPAPTSSVSSEKRDADESDG